MSSEFKQGDAAVINVRVVCAPSHADWIEVEFHSKERRFLDPKFLRRPIAFRSCREHPPEVGREIIWITGDTGGRVRVAPDPHQRAFNKEAMYVYLDEIPIAEPERNPYLVREENRAYTVGRREGVFEFVAHASFHCAESKYKDLAKSRADKLAAELNAAEDCGGAEKA